MSWFLFKQSEDNFYKLPPPQLSTHGICVHVLCTRLSPPRLPIDELYGLGQSHSSALDLAYCLKTLSPGTLGGSAVELLLFGPGCAPKVESHIGLPAWNLLLPLRVSLPLSLCL